MELQHLLEFAALVKHKSFTKAAKEMFVSQPALSKHIAALEKELGFTLLKRNSRNILITEEGEIVYRYAMKIASQFDQMRDDIVELNANDSGELIIASKAMQTHFGISEIVHSFRLKYPNIDVKINDSFLGQPNPFLSDDIELAFTHLIKGAGKSYEYEILLRDQLAIILPENHPLASRKRIDFAQLRDETFICISEEFEAICRKLAKKNGFEANIYRLTDTYIDSAYEYVRWKAGVCLSPHRLFDDIGTKECIAIDLSPAIRHDMYLAKRSNVPLSKEASLFWNFIKDFQ